MSRSKFHPQAEFNAIAPNAFAFLLRMGFVVQKSDHGLYYYSPGLSVEICLDRREETLVTLLGRQIGSYHRRGRLPCLYAESGLGPAQAVRQTARSTHSLRVSVASQARALFRLMARVGEGRGDELLLKCHGR